MRAIKIPIIIVLLLTVYALFMVPMSEGAFPSWFNAQIVEFMLAIFIVVLFLALWR